LNVLGNLESLVRILKRSVQMPIPGFGVAFFVVLDSGPVTLGCKAVGFRGLSVQTLNAIA
jgi:hypothetical protein